MTTKTHCEPGQPHRFERITSGAFRGWFKCWLCGRKCSK